MRSSETHAVHEPPRITLDTNQLVRVLMRPPQLATFVMAWETRRFTVVCSRELMDEYERVLNNPRVRVLIYPELLRAFLGHLVHDLERVQLSEVVHLCRDPDDDIVIATAICGAADYLVTADEDLRTPEVVKALATASIVVTTMDDFIRLLDHRP